MTKNEILREFVRAEINFDSGKADYIDDAFTPVLDLVYRLVNKTNDIHSVMSTLKVCGTGCNGIVINGTCNNCGAKW